MSKGLTTDPGLNIPTGLSLSAGLSGPNGGLSFEGFGGGSPPPPGPTNGLTWGSDYLVWGAGNNMTWG